MEGKPIEVSVNELLPWHGQPVLVHTFEIFNEMQMFTRAASQAIYGGEQHTGS